jgi:hypothetical protein
MGNPRWKASTRAHLWVRAAWLTGGQPGPASIWEPIALRRGERDISGGAGGGRKWSQTMPARVHSLPITWICHLSDLPT